MIGRISKENGIFYCITGIKKFPILFDSKNKIKNGDLIKINATLNFENKIPKIIRTSEIKIIRSIYKKNIPAINHNTPIHERLKHRIIDLRRPENHLLFTLKNELIKFLRIFFDENGFVEVITPTIVGAMIEGRVEKFKIKFHNKDAFLTMTKLPSLYLLICADFPNVYQTSSLFVAGKQNTRYHVNEFFVLDWATSNNVDLKKQMKFIDNFLNLLINYLVNYTKLEKINLPEFQNLLSKRKHKNVISYKNLIKKYLNDFPQDEIVKNQLHIPQRVINHISKIIGDYFWVIEFPEKFKQFYCKTNKKNSDDVVVLAGELWWKNIKVASLSISDIDSNKIRKRLKILRLDKKNFKTYLNAVDYASNEAALGSVYLDRLTMILFDLKNIREGILFPRSHKQSVLDP